MQDQLLKNRSVNLAFPSCLSLGLTPLTDADDKRKATVTNRALHLRKNICHCPFHLTSALGPITPVFQTPPYLWAKLDPEKTEFHESWAKQKIGTQIPMAGNS